VPRCYAKLETFSEFAPACSFQDKQACCASRVI